MIIHNLSNRRRDSLIKVTDMLKYLPLILDNAHFIFILRFYQTTRSKYTENLEEIQRN